VEYYLSKCGRAERGHTPIRSFTSSNSHLSRSGCMADLTPASLAALGASPPLSTAKIATAVRAGRSPVVLVSCGSFSPPTLLHLRIFEDARDAIGAEGGAYEAVGGFMSPVHAAYGKASLAPMHDRLNMARRSLADSSWVGADEWECCQEGWTRTAEVLERFRQELAAVAVRVGDAEPVAGLVRVMLLCGGDLLETFAAKRPDGRPVWAEADQQTILSRNGVVCLERAGTDLGAVVAKHGILSSNQDNIVVVRMAAENTISSTLVRKTLAAGRSAKYLCADACLDYIAANKLEELEHWQ